MTDALWIACVAGTAALLVLAIRAVAREPRDPSSGDLRLHRLADGVYLYRGFFSNSAVFVLPSAVVVVDTQVSPFAGQRLRSEIERVTALPITHVINTHYHGDHSGGNAAFPEAEIIATAETARYVVERDSERVEYAETFGLEFVSVHPTVPPTRTFEGRLTLETGGGRLEIAQIGRAETPDACVVHWPARHAVATGDGVATRDYPYLGVPFLDEGLRDDGSWLGFFSTIRGMDAELLLPGHGPALIGKDRIHQRLDLLTELLGGLLAAVKGELARGRPIPELVEAVDRRFARFRSRSDLEEKTVSQRFAIYRCINNLSPDRAGKGWWDDLRPSVIARADGSSELERIGPHGVLPRATALAGARHGRPLAIGLLEARLASHPEDAAAWALLSDVLFDGSRGVRPSVDATEYIAAATNAAKRALAIDPDAKLALLNLGSAEVFGAMVLAQPMDRALSKLERALAAGGLTNAQRAKAHFFLGKAHQMEGRDADSDRCYRELLPRGTRALFPLLRNRLRAYP